MSNKILISDLPFGILKIGDKVHSKNNTEDEGIIYYVNSNTKNVGIYWANTGEKTLLHVNSWDATVYAEHQIEKKFNPELFKLKIGRTSAADLNKELILQLTEDCFDYKIAGA